MGKSTTAKAVKRCLTCKHARLLQHGNNPIIAECLMHPQPWNTKFPYEREVANWPNSCSDYVVNLKNKEIIRL
ncbi:hypothetical protein L6472_06010 [Prevotella sp. E13-17]|uniref:hypothetical protein n=1 Tax=Prevotella sp. E13-17 TaxID=2913616 RepID=UPI001EDC39D4|nr:hypothetical protein [Prevotella sp. E13-17]UKK52132.1 hypothetical protein L6472_06010 [Prevotella sp. E13-17]